MEEDIKKPPRSKVNSKLGYYQLESLAGYLNNELPHLRFHVRMMGRRLIQSVRSTQALSEVGADQIEKYWKSYCRKYNMWFNPLLFPPKSKLSLSILEDSSEGEYENSGDSDSFDYDLHQKKPINKFKQYNNFNQQYQLNEPGQYSNVNNYPHQNQVSEPGQYSNFNHVDNRQHHNQINKPRQRRTSSLNYPIEGEKITDEGVKVTIEYGQREGEHINHIPFNNGKFRENIDYMPMPSHNENFNSQKSRLRSSKNNYMSLGPLS
ncbi:hypothetical protein [Piscirickettsia salmonis]|uniref:hypothetical protein n=1 Tax=Piscirickettsia salmonis TaxID=1238 RepID=UPI00065F63E9|nr:hypothetical protein [Piscirickettsia salmonis]AKP73535.1 hypothetical protein PSLF89_1688 [Piscirickettsia salmonis LF-89 = ATCC VR-1361]